jgi:hypothetical protein
VTDHLPTLYGGVFPSRVERQASRALHHIDVATAVALRADAARIGRITETTKRGMRAACRISAEEILITRGDPLTEARVRMVADRGVACIANVVEGTGGGF